MAEKRKTTDISSEQQTKKNHWSTALSTAISDEGVQLYKDDLCTVIKDKFPKAKIHLLVLPNEHIQDLKAINGSHLPLLKHMLKVGKEVAEKEGAKRNGSMEFRYGYHAIPSMALLHMHVISQDFISDTLKTKKHWNSFTTDYFLDASNAIDSLQANNFIRIDTSQMKKLLDNDLQCHRCSAKLSNMPKLKQHLLIHQ